MGKQNQSKKVDPLIAAIHDRNARVEADKAWETSWARRLIIAAITYVLASALLVWIRAPEPFLAALVPTMGYVLSTLSLLFVKNWWLKNRYGK